MNFSRAFILRPIGTTLLAIGLTLIGLVSYYLLPVSSLPNFAIPFINVTASRPGADPATMAATVAAPLERRLGEIAGVTEITSSSGLGSTRISLVFDPKRKIDSAARDVQGAINAALAELPSDLPALPSFRKANPAAAPIIIVALTSKSMPAAAVYDIADSIIAQRIAQVQGVAQVNISGAEQPAIRVKINPAQVTALGMSIEDIRIALTNANIVTPLGAIDGTTTLTAIETNAQLLTVADYKRLVIKAANGTVVHLGDVAEVVQGTRNTRSAATFNRDASVLLFITKEGDANVIDTVDRVKALLPEIQKFVPQGIDFTIMSDRTLTIRASVKDMEFTLTLAIVLVMLVVFLFLRRASPTIAAGITVPLSLAGTLGCMWLAGFSINNLTLMALAVSVGFVVDDAIVMIENMYRNLERGLTPLQAALAGARQIGFTVISISVSLLAAFIPLLFMGGIVGGLLREFSVTLAFAIIVSTIVSLSVTPMICGHFVKAPASPDATRFDRVVEGSLAAMENAYANTLAVALRWKWSTLLVLCAVIAATVNLYIKAPKGFFPQDDAGLISASTEAAPDISFERMSELQRRLVEIVLKDPAVAHVGSSTGSSFFNATANAGRMFIALKPLAERDGKTSQQVIDRLRRPVNAVEGIRTFMFAIQDVQAGGRQSKSKFQFTLWGPDSDALYAAVPKVLERVRKLPNIEDVTTDREQGGSQLTVTIDRVASARLGVATQDINNALNNAFAQRQVSLIYGTRNQYRVVLEVDPRYQRDPSDLSRVFVQGTKGVEVPILNVIKVERGLAPLVVNHQGPFPAVTISYNLTDGASIDDARAGLTQAIAELNLPESIRAEAAGDAKAFAAQAGAQPLLIVAALLAVYIVLGVLYESLAHPLTIISTLPSAGLGALVALQLYGMELSLIAFIGIILLIGIVKKNGIMLVDFALEAERTRGLSPEAAVFEAARVRFRPILMTTLAALLGAVPLAIASGPGAELRRPLGITIIGGLVVSQILTLYTTPAVYLLLDRLHHKLTGRARVPVQVPAAVPAE
jgi:hydrophobe/amphiphile efflux-1 (HAE1) family protein